MKRGKSLRPTGRIYLLANLRSSAKWRIEINKIDIRIPELAPVAQLLQIITEIKSIHSVEMFIARSAIAPLASRGAQRRACLFAAHIRLCGTRFSRLAVKRLLEDVDLRVRNICLPMSILRD